MTEYKYTIIKIIIKRMFNPGLIQKNYQATVPLIRNSTNLVLDNIQRYACSKFSNNKSKWDEPIEIPPVLYSKFGVPLPPSSKQLKLYPQSLLDYIKKAYEKCRDDNQKIIMEKLLREIVRTHENDLNQINWQSYPLPSVQQEATKQSIARLDDKKNPNPVRSRLNQIRLPSSYNIVQQEKPSKALEIAKKRMEKLQQKLKMQNKQQEGKSLKQTFIGFSTTPPAPVPPVPEIKMPRFNMNPPQFPPPTSPAITPNALSVKTSLTHGLTNKQSISPTILKYEINDKPMDNFKEKLKQKQREKEKQRIKQQEQERERIKERERLRQKQREKERQKERAREKEKEKARQKQIQREKQKQKEKQKQRQRAIQKQKQKEQAKVTKKQMQILDLVRGDEHLDQVARRFKDFYKLKSDNYQKTVQEDDEDLDSQQVIVGKNQSIEKPYLRITGRPNPDTVRPEPILKKALKHFLDKYQKDKNYEYLISQLRSIRQDLTVQHIKNGFTIQVYEQNLEISLYEKDIPQFKHCQTTLWQLYAQGHYYTEQSRIKFICHQMTTLIMEEKSQEMQFMLTKIPQGALQHPEVQQCLKLKQQLIVGNYCAFFRYFDKQSKFIKCLLDLYLDKMLVKFLLMICKTGGEKVPIKSLCSIVGQYDNKLQTIIKAENGVTLNGFLMLKPSHEQFLKSEHLATKKVTVLLG